MNVSPKLQRTAVSLVLISCFYLPTQAITFTNDTYIASGDSTFDNLDIIITNCTVTVDGPHNFASIHLLNSGHLTHSPSNSLNLVVAADCEVEQGAGITADGNGFGSDAGPGAGSSKSTNSPFFYIAGA